MTSSGSAPDLNADAIADDLRARGLRWTSQRRSLLQVLARTDGHVTGSELVERCREVDPSTTPSTVYRTLRVLEDLGVVRHAHGPDGREEFHVRPDSNHGHLHCEHCAESWEISPADAAATVESFRARFDFDVDLSHLTVVGRCASCRTGEEA